MSHLPLSESTHKMGLYELFQELTGLNPTSYSKRRFARDANNALARFMFLAMKSSQKHQVDDTRNSDYPIIDIDIVSGQRDYSFTNDASTTPNQIWTVDRVEIKDASGNWIKLDAYDEMAQESAISTTTSGTPTKYYQLANGVWFDITPNYSSSGGLRIYFKRAPFYFIGDDTDDAIEAGIPDMFKEYLAYRPAYLYSIVKLPTLSAGFLDFVAQTERDIPSYYYMRNSSQRKGMKVRVENTR